MPVLNGGAEDEDKHKAPSLPLSHPLSLHHCRPSPKKPTRVSSLSHLPGLDAYTGRASAVSIFAACAIRLILTYCQIRSAQDLAEMTAYDLCSPERRNEAF